jgi:predicted nucleic-acid-binding Zn-ribbon protein
MPSTTPDDGESDPDFVYCASCGSKAPTSWSFCRSCQSSLDDARPASDGPAGWKDDVRTIEETGCPKCGHEEAEVDEITTTGAGLSKLFDVQNRRFQVVSCTNCGYSELYRGHDADVIVDLFLGG